MSSSDSRRGGLDDPVTETENEQNLNSIPLPDQDSLLTPEDVARRFQVPKSWIYGSIRGRSKDKLPHIYVGRYLRFEESAVREFLERRRKCYPARTGNGN